MNSGKSECLEAYIGITHPHQPTIPQLEGGDVWQRYCQKHMGLKCKGQLEIRSICSTILFTIEPGHRTRLISVAGINHVKVMVLWRRGSSNCVENQAESRVKSRAAALKGWKPPTVPVDEFVVYQGRRSWHW